MATLTIELPDAALRDLSAEAEAKGRSASALASDIVKARLAALERARAEAQDVLNGPNHDFFDSADRLRRKNDIPNYSHLTPDQLAEQAQADLAQLTPERLAEAERLGLL